jgi:K+-sensing histidine kinase KdpD
MNEKQLDLINDVGGWDPDKVEVPRDELSQTGLGLGLVRTVVLDRGGQIRAARAPEGGALVVMRLPVDTPALSVTTPASPVRV